MNITITMNQVRRILFRPGFAQGAPHAVRSAATVTNDPESFWATMNDPFWMIQIVGPGVSHAALVGVALATIDQLIDRPIPEIDVVRRYLAGSIQDRQEVFAASRRAWAHFERVNAAYLAAWRKTWPKCDCPAEKTAMMIARAQVLACRALAEWAACGADSGSAAVMDAVAWACAYLAINDECAERIVRIIRDA